MPLDPSILLGSTSFQDQYQKQQAALAQAQAQQNQLQLQKYSVLQAKQDFMDQQNMRQAWRQANGDPTQTLAIAAQLGVSPKAIQGFQKNQMELTALLDTHNKTVAETGKTNLDTMIEKNDNIYGKLSPLANATSQVEFESKKPLVLSALKGLASDDEINALSGANQQQVQDWMTSHLSIKSTKDLMDANSAAKTAQSKADEVKVNQEKQANEAAGQIADSQQKTLATSSTSLQNVYKTQGPVAYQRALDQLVTNDPKNGGVIKAAFPTGADLVTKSPADAVSAISDGGLTDEQRQQKTQAAAQLAETSQYHQQEIALRKQSTAIQQQMLGLDYSKTQAAMFQAGLGMDGKPIAENDKTLLTPNVQNTSDGRTFIDQDTAFKGLPKGQQLQLKQSAASQGIPMLSSKEAASVRDVDNARNTITGVFNTFMQSAGAGISGLIGHVTGAQGLSNYGSSLSGVNPDLNAARKNFLAAIETMKSAGGQGSGLRITGAEIQRIGQLMPGMNDTQEMLQRKLSQINTLMNDKMNSALHKVPVTNSSANTNTPSNAPKIGTISQGYKYMGGDPSLQSSWSKQ